MILDRQLIISWCPSHMGIAENEFIDQQLRNHRGDKAAFLLTRRRLLRDMRTRTEDMWKRIWRKNKSASLLRFKNSRSAIHPTLGTNRNRFIVACHNSIQLFSRFVRIGTNHMPSSEYRERFRFTGNTLACQFCPRQPPFSREHIMCRCVRYVDRFSSLYAFNRLRQNFVALIAFLKRNPSAVSFADFES